MTHGFLDVLLELLESEIRGHHASTDDERRRTLYRETNSGLPTALDALGMAILTKAPLPFLVADRQIAHDRPQRTPCLPLGLPAPFIRAPIDRVMRGPECALIRRAGSRIRRGS